VCDFERKREISVPETTFKVVRSYLLFLISAFALFATDIGEKMATSISRMQAAAEKQQASVARQAAGFSPWFTSVSMQEQVTGNCDALHPDTLRKMIVEASTREGVNPMLVEAMAHRESAGRPCAVSEKGAQGVMQLMPDTATELGVQDPFDPEQNIAAGARYIKQMLIRYKGDLRLALAAYSAGPRRVDAAKDVPGIAETQAYVASILSVMRKLEEPAQEIQ
jgi:soluble lytic murein transglycosylase-like protein